MVGGVHAFAELVRRGEIPVAKAAFWVTAIDTLGQHGDQLVAYRCSDREQAEIVLENAAARPEFAHARIREERPVSTTGMPVRYVEDTSSLMYQKGGFVRDEPKFEGWANLATFTAHHTITNDARLYERAEGLLRIDPSGGKLRDFALVEVNRPRTPFDESFRDMRSDVERIAWHEIAADLCETFGIERKPPAIEGPGIGL